MKLEQQVCSLELAKKLKKLGVKQESLAYWKENLLHLCDESTLHAVENVTSYCAFTVAELGEMLPDEVHDGGEQNLMCIKFFNGSWMVRYEDDDRESIYHSESAPIEANARAKMLIYLLENKLT